MPKFDIYHSLEILKAAFPHLDSRSKNTLELFIKVGDLLEILSRNRYKSDVSAYSFSDDESKSDKTDVVGMLTSVRKVCKDDEIKIVDNLLNLINAFELYETYQSLFSMMSSENDLGEFSNMFGMGDLSNNPADMMEMFTSMLSPEGKEIMNNINEGDVSYDNEETYIDCYHNDDENVFLDDSNNTKNYDDYYKDFSKNYNKFYNQLINDNDDYEQVDDSDNDDA